MRAYREPEITKPVLFIRGCTHKSEESPQEDATPDQNHAGVYEFGAPIVRICCHLLLRTIGQHRVEKAMRAKAKEVMASGEGAKQSDTVGHGPRGGHGPSTVGHVENPSLQTGELSVGRRLYDACLHYMRICEYTL